MKDDIFAFSDDFERQEGEPQAIGEILEELLTQYQERFPEARITVVEVPVAA